MRLLLLHLSDIHLKVKHNPILARLPKIRDALRNLDHEITSCVLVISGDIAYSGQVEEYQIALQFVEDLRQQLKESLPRIDKVRLVMIPGNHDCYIPDDKKHDDFRNSMVDAVTKDISKASNQRIVETCVEPQQHFFGFLRNSFDGELPLENNKIFYRYEFELESQKILFLCYNTAWIVRRDVSQEAKLIFPTKLAEYRGQGKYDLVVSLFHHPYNWLQNENAREFRSKIQATSNLALTGHEHHNDAPIVETRKGERIQYFEGGVLQDSYDDENSSFNTILLDLQNRKQRLVQFVWDKDLYRPTPDSDQDFSGLQLDQLKNTGKFEVRTDYLKYLDDAGANLRHPVKGKLTLKDCLLDIELSKVNVFKTTALLDDDTVKLKLSGLSREITLSKLTFISGADKSGKSTTMKVVYQELLERGLIPVSISADSISRARTREINDKIDDALKEQYTRIDKDKFDQLDNNQKVLLIDDFEANDLNQKARESLLELVSNQFGHVVVFVSNFLPDVEEALLEENGLPPFQYFKILSVSNEIIQDTVHTWTKWLDEDTLSEEALLTKIDVTSSLLNAAIRGKYVPPRPIFILATIQLIQNNFLVDTSITSYGMGYVYQKLINQALTTYFKKEELHFEERYLSFVAYQIHKTRGWMLSENEMMKAHDAYCNTHDVSTSKVKYEETVSSFVKADIFQKSNGCIGFKYKYTHYFFVAFYLRERFSDPTIQDEIRGFAQTIHQQYSADILLFLTHLSKERLILEILLEVARGAISEVPPIDLEEDIGFLNQLQQTLKSFPTLYYEKTKPLEERRKRAKERDSLRRISEDGDRDEENSIESTAIEFRTAPNVIQIMGQVLKNYPLALEGDIKANLTKETYFVGLRILKLFFNVFEGNFETLTQNFIHEKSVEGKTSDEELATLKESFSEVLFLIAASWAYAIISFIGDAVFATDLDETYKRVLQETNTPAVKLIDAWIRLNQPIKDWKNIFTYNDDFISNPLARTILKVMVYEHLKLFSPRDRAQLQQVCDKFEISRKERVRLKLTSGTENSKTQ